MNKRRTITVGLTAALVLAVALPAQGMGFGQVKRERRTTVPVSTTLILEAIDCENSGGAVIRLGGTDEYGPAAIDVVLASPGDKGSGTKAAEAQLSLTVVPGSLQGIEGMEKGGPDGVGGNPWIWKVVKDGEDIVDQILLGRCVQGFKTQWTETDTVDMTITAGYRTRSCRANSTTMEVEALDVSSNAPATLSVDLGFGNQDPYTGKNNKRHVKTDVVTAQFTLGRGPNFPVGKDFRDSKLGGNPAIFSGTLDSEYWSGDNYLGRCKDLLG